MKVIRRLYRYLASYKAWALLAFGSMVIFALTQTVLISLIRPLMDEVLVPAAAKTAAVKQHESREDKAKEYMLNAVLNRDRPEGQRGWLVNGYDRAAKNLDTWWNRNPAEK